MAYAEPRVEVIEVMSEGDTTRTSVRFLEGDPPGPLAPAGLYSLTDARQERAQLHKAARRHGKLATFETYNRPEKELKGCVGETLIYRPWWTSAAMDAALDAKAIWVRRLYPDNGDHDHCLFTWESMAADIATNAGYWCQEHGWITEKAYREVIANDMYRLRGG